jgi:hypothetical protein
MLFMTSITVLLVLFPLLLYGKQIRRENKALREAKANVPKAPPEPAPKKTIESVPKPVVIPPAKEGLRTIQTEQLKELTAHLPGVTITDTVRTQRINISGEVTRDVLKQLLQILKAEQVAFQVYDQLYPDFGPDMDPGSYMTYSRQKAIDTNFWSMTYGNQGWSGGTYYIQEFIIIAQIENLIRLKIITGIEVDKGGIFSRYDVKPEEENTVTNQEIYKTHTTVGDH